MDMVVLIDTPAFSASTGSRLLKRSAAAAVEDAAALVRVAAEHTQQAQATAMAVHEEARQQGWRRGLTQARDDLAERLAVAQAARQVALQDLAPTLADIVADAVTLLVRSAPREALLASALHAVGGLLRQARWARLRVHPDDATGAQAALRDARGECAAAEMVTVVCDASIGAGGCVFETDVGTADASLGVQLAAIRAAVRSSLGESSGPATGRVSMFEPDPRAPTALSA